MRGNRWLILVAMTGSLSMVMLDQTVVTVALPTMTEQLGLTAGSQQWVINAYVLAMASLVAFGGKWGDATGRVTAFKIGVAVFVVASLCCGLVPTGEWGAPLLIGCRALQGVGAALMMPVSAVIVMGAFPLAQRGKAMAVYVGISQVFLAVGPLLGGLLTEYVSWRAVFFLNVVVGPVALLLVHLAGPPDTRERGAVVRIPDLLLMVSGLGLTIVALQQSASWGWASPATLGLLTAGILVTMVFVLRQLRLSAPLIDLRLFRRRDFLADNVVMALLQFGLLAAILYCSLYLQDLLHMSPLSTGLALLPLIVPVTLGAQLGGRWFDRGGVRPPVLTGIATSVAGLALWTSSLPLLDYRMQVPGMVLTGLGLGLTMSPTNTDALSRVPEAERAQGSGLVQTSRQLGGTLGVAVIGTIVLGRMGVGTSAADPQQAAGAITVGFAASTLAFALALLVGWRLLARDRISAGGSDGRSITAPGARPR